MSARISDCTGALIAGGRATRLGGRPKGLLRVGGEPIAARSLRLFRALFDGGALVVANDPAPYAPLGAPIVPDLVKGKGAPGGVHAALSAARTTWVFTAGCDMPFVSEAGIALLASRRAGAEAVVVRWQGRLEPLHALWSRACLPLLSRLLAEGDPSLQAIARSVAAAIVEESEWRAVDPEGLAFANVNTPEDLARLGLVPPP
ncbi:MULTISPECIES: molybdenum cofactor guanylyltransferase [Anaeromyxobacter]|uniref:molybdenum cofactor guanylyltransferase n=1 Tax=Anaeromyxobacter TaxID=161492 RepID=UPI001F5AFE6F|nr:MULTISPECIES: molybdenum cofactor guanylyltransferase [unclassified Anaeromyxobacter]